MCCNNYVLLTQDSATATPLTDLSAGSERSTLSRGGACFFNPSRGTDDEGYQMELDDSYDRLVCFRVKIESDHPGQAGHIFYESTG